MMRLHPVDWEFLGVLYWDVVISAIVLFAGPKWP